MNLITRARNFAHAAHDAIGQKRKYTGQPYHVHTDMVAYWVDVFNGNEYQVAAANLHDWREDVWTELTKQGRLTERAAFELLEEKFPEPVRLLVCELTDVYTSENFPSLNRDERKRLEALRLATISNEAKTIKLADLFDNTADITKNDPAFAVTYLKEKARILPGLVGGNPELWNKVNAQLIACTEELNRLNVGDEAKIISDSSWKGKKGIVLRVFPENGAFSLCGLEIFPVAFFKDELQKVIRTPKKS